MTTSDPDTAAFTPPGATPRSSDLTGQLEAALRDKGAGYVPRTHHLEGGTPRFINRLLLESSPYLLQHAHNPVDWYPWGDEAFETARRLGRPVFLSIGYSTCHWCHVMEEESFEDLEIAELLNRNYVPIKVDREERPDVDAIYMSAVQALTGQGGWPMSVWLNADREPFFGGTYFPPRDGARGARTGFFTLLREIAATVQNDPERVGKATASLTEAIKTHMEGRPKPPSGAPALTRAPIENAVRIYDRLFDDVHGGLRRAPKFPSNVPVRVLLRHHRRTGDERALEMATVTLAKMAAGGMYDQIGGGFHRYSTDAAWLVPHFEKMLYDNALLAVAYAEAWQVTHRPDFARVLREVLDYFLREMTAPEGGLYSATDADSEGEEGKFFVWSAAEIRALLGPEAERFMRHFDITEGGNFEGASIPNVRTPDEAERAALEPARQRLYEARAKRIPPLRDDKILAAWNGLGLSALAVGGRVLAEPRTIEAARRAADFLLEKLCRGDRVLRSWKDGRASAHGFLEDQAFVTQGLLDLYEGTFEPRWLEAALRIARATEAAFGDPEAGGWFMTPADGEVLIAREKPTYDGAEPSGTSVALLNAARLAVFTEDDGWQKVVERGFASVWPVLAEQPHALSEALLALDFVTDVPKEIALVAPLQIGELEPLRDVLRETFLPNRALAGGVAGQLPQATVPWLAEKVARGAAPTAYVCEHGRCDAPTGDPAHLRAQLGKG